MEFKKFKKNVAVYFILIIYSFLFTAVNFTAINTDSQIFDYTFHAGRIVGLAQSLANADWLPNLNFVFVHGAGYAVPMFYGNWQLYIPAIVFRVTKLITLSYASYALLLILLTVLSSYYVMNKMTHNKKRAFVFALIVPFLFPYYGYGMTAVVPMIPILIYCIYKVIYLDDRNPILLAVTISLLIQTHIISTIVLAITSFIVVLFNVRKLTKKKIFSFTTSILVAIPLSFGFILQYLEQSQSQVFFVNWKLRDFPFTSDSLMNPGNIVDTLTGYVFPSALIILLCLIIFIKKFDTYSKQLIAVSVILLLLSSNILPWNTFLKYTFLSVFQYTSRLTYFIPVLIFIALMKSGNKYIVFVLMLFQMGYYAINYTMLFTANTSPYAIYGLSNSNKEVMDTQNAQAFYAYQNPNISAYDTSGDEYFNLNVNHDNVRNGKVNQFYYDSDDVEIKNISQGYNKLEFDIVLQDGEKAAMIVLPRIWYKGYSAIYSEGASGNQPHQIKELATLDNSEDNTKSGKPSVNYKVLYDGQASIDVSNSGHVVIEYKKTIIQLIGYITEIISYIIILVYLSLRFIKSKGT
ncbi:hypothetical protein [Streptococcus lutetiensis]|uniref:hypothetical protein n=1 Tax=Streptococcus lutetiensis TaxID=150055 RepID=UPI00117FAB7B|nr:hypothetical protein [Streptococcus lutetiensis]